MAWTFVFRSSSVSASAEEVERLTEAMHRFNSTLAKRIIKAQKRRVVVGNDGELQSIYLAAGDAKLKDLRRAGHAEIRFRARMSGARRRSARYKTG